LRNGDHTRDVVSDVTHLVERQRMLIVTNGKNSVRIGRVFADYDGDDAVKFFGAAGIDTLDARMRIRRMQNFPDQHAGHAEVVSIFAGAGGLFRRVDHRGGLSDDGKISHSEPWKSKTKMPVISETSLFFSKRHCIAASTAAF